MMLFVQSGNGFGISYNQNHFYFRIDHILLSKNLESYQCTVDKNHKEFGSLSHLVFCGEEIISRPLI